MYSNAPGKVAMALRANARAVCFSLSLSRLSDPSLMRSLGVASVDAPSEVLEGAWLDEAAADDDVALVDVGLLARVVVSLVVDVAPPAAALEVVLDEDEAESDDPPHAVRASRARASIASFFMG